MLITQSMTSPLYIIIAFFFPPRISHGLIKTNEAVEEGFHVPR